MERDISGIRQKATNDLVVPYHSVRRSIGVLGLFLPASLIVFGLFSADGILDSMSAYYYSPMREIFVGTLCALAVFLWAYEGYRPDPGDWLSDRNTARAASLGAAGIALLPTGAGRALGAEGAPAVESQPVACTLAQCLLGEEWAGRLHVIAAALFFLAMAAFCLLLFTRGDASDPQKCANNRIYRTCGWVILIALALIGTIELTGLRQALAAIRPVFWLEVIASIAIAISWITKGDAILSLRRRLIR